MTVPEDVVNDIKSSSAEPVYDVDLLTEIVAVPGLMALNTTLKEVSSDDNNLPVPPPSVLNPFTYCNILAS